MEQVLAEFSIDEQEYMQYFQKLSEYSESPSLHEVSMSFEKIQRRLQRLVIHVTNYCNLKCKYCYANGGNYHSEEKDIDISTIDKTLNLFYHDFDQIDSIQIFGGEPLLNLDAIEYLCESVRKINKEKGNNTAFGLVTNGVNMNDKFIQLVIDCQIQVTVSYDGNPEINNLLRVNTYGEGTSDIVLYNCKKMRQLTETQPSTIEVTYTNYHAKAQVSIQNVVRHIADELPNIYVHLVPAGGSGDAPYVVENLEIFSDSIDEIFASFHHAAPFTYSLAERIFNALHTTMPGSRYICDAGIGTISVSVNGDIYPCFMFTDMKELKLGNVNSENVFSNWYYCIH